MANKEQETPFICMACQNEKTNYAPWHSHAICGDCHKILKKGVYNCNALEMRLIGNFYIFIAGLKYAQEKQEIQKYKRKQRRILEQ